MEDLYLSGTKKTPEIKFDYNQGKFEISGRSIPENSIEFYKPVIHWLNQYIKDPKEETSLHMKLEYFNTSSSKCLVEIFRKLETLSSQGKDIKVKWYYEKEDEDMMDSGEDFKAIIRVPIQMVMLDD